MNFYVQKNNNAISILIKEDKEEGRERRREVGRKAKSETEEKTL